MAALEFYFREKMAGTVQRRGERFDRTFHFELDVRAPNLLDLATTAVGQASGTLHIDGLARAAAAVGRIEISPVLGQSVRYVLSFTGEDGQSYSFDGAKRTTVRRHLVGWTTLPGQVMDASGGVWGDARLRFSLRHELRPLLASVRVGRRALAAPAAAAALGSST